MKTYGGGEGTVPSFLTSALKVSRHLHDPGDRTLSDYCIGDWGGPQSKSGRCGTPKTICSCRESNLWRPARSLSLYRLPTPGGATLALVQQVTVPSHTQPTSHLLLYPAGSVLHTPCAWGCKQKQSPYTSCIFCVQTMDTEHPMLPRVPCCTE
jgi:hypothetical protein